MVESKRVEIGERRLPQKRKDVRSRSSKILRANQRPTERNDLSPKPANHHNLRLAPLPPPIEPRFPPYIQPHSPLQNHGRHPLGREASRLPSADPLRIAGLNRKLLFLDVPRSNPSGTPSGRVPPAPAQALGSGLRVRLGQGQQILPHGRDLPRHVRGARAVFQTTVSPCPTPILPAIRIAIQNQWHRNISTNCVAMLQLHHLLPLREGSYLPAFPW